MSQRMSRTDTRRRNRNRRLITFAWVVGITVLIIVLLYKEKADWLYVMATLGLSALLVIVALADLRGKHGVDEASLGDDAAAIGDGITTIASPTTAATAASLRGAKSRKARRK